MSTTNPCFVNRVPKPRYNEGAMWCAHPSVKDNTHETSKCSKFKHRVYKPMQHRICKNCVYSGEVITA